MSCVLLIASEPLHMCVVYLANGVVWFTGPYQEDTVATWTGGRGCELCSIVFLCFLHAYWLALLWEFQCFALCEWVWLTCMLYYVRWITVMPEQWDRNTYCIFSTNISPGTICMFVLRNEHLMTYVHVCACVVVPTSQQMCWSSAIQKCWLSWRTVTNTCLILNLFVC